MTCPQWPLVCGGGCSLRVCSVFWGHSRTPRSRTGWVSPRGPGLAAGWSLQDGLTTDVAPRSPRGGRGGRTVPARPPAAARNAAFKQADTGHVSAHARAFPWRGPGVGLGPRWLVALSTPVRTAPSGRRAPSRCWPALNRSANAAPHPTPLRPSKEPGRPVMTGCVNTHCPSNGGVH